MPQMNTIVEFEINEGYAGDFTVLMKDHARRTLFEEEGCLRFDVLHPVDDSGAPLPNRLMVNELYADEIAHKAHGETARLDALRAAIGPMIKSSRRVVASLIDDQADEAGIPPEKLNASNDG